MSATPIPRSLAMVHYGDCDLSVIAQKPPLRKPVITRVMPTSKIDDITQSLQRVITSGGRAYWVCPLVEESEKMDLMAAIDRFNLLADDYPNQVGLVHGKMKPAEKDMVISDFMSGKITILVSTTVIEVGVNVPEATVMIIEQAERFGLSQLHQLRGRVGRGKTQASCLLLYKTLNPTAIERLSILRETEDGFLLAEKDLRLRGAGDLLGTKQTGVLALPAFDFNIHEFLIKTARDDAQYILASDPDFTSDRGKNLQILLKIFKPVQRIV
jgi:ATP-dependent DNA helicase RecG